MIVVLIVSSNCTGICVYNCGYKTYINIRYRHRIKERPVELYCIENRTRLPFNVVIFVCYCYILFVSYVVNSLYLLIRFTLHQFCLSLRGEHTTYLYSARLRYCIWFSLQIKITRATLTKEIVHF